MWKEVDEGNKMKKNGEKKLKMDIKVGEKGE